MPSKKGSKKKTKKGGKKSAKSPAEEALAKSDAEVRSLRDHLSRTLLTVETTEYRYRRAQDNRIKSAETLDELRQAAQEQTAFLVTQHEMTVFALNEKVNQLEESLSQLNTMVSEKDEELNKLKVELAESLSERDRQVKHLKTHLANQGMLFEDSLTTAFNRLTDHLASDFDAVHKNYQPWSEISTRMAELEYLRPPFFDEGSTEWY